MYRLKKGVALFRMCGECFIFPSRSANPPLLFITPVSQELADFLNRKKPAAAVSELSEEAQNKLQRLQRMRLVEDDGT